MTILVARSQFGTGEKILKPLAYWPVVLAILFCALPIHRCVCASTRECELIPGRDGKDLTRGNKRVVVGAPNGWEVKQLPTPMPIWFKPRDFEVALGPVGKSDCPFITVEASHRGRHNTVEVTPRNSSLAGNLDVEFKELRRIDSFDAGVNGILDVWRIRTYNDNYLLVLLVQPDAEGRTEVDVYLSGENPAQLTQCLNSLKEVARSIRIVNR
jgi:hypothetical protein